MDDAGTSGRSLALRADHVEDVLNDMRGLVTGVQALLEAPIMRGRHLFTSGGQRYAKEISIQVRYESYTPFNDRVAKKKHCTKPQTGIQKQHCCSDLKVVYDGWY